MKGLFCHLKYSTWFRWQNTFSTIKKVPFHQEQEHFIRAWQITSVKFYGLLISKEGNPLTDKVVILHIFTEDFEINILRMGCS